MRCCCICHKPCGVNIELHHIKQEADGGKSTLDNCIPLCFDHHADVKHYDPRHPKGNKFSETELQMHRDKWFALVQQGGLCLQDEALLEMDRRLARDIHEFMTRDNSYEFVRFESMKSSFRYQKWTTLCDLMDAMLNPDMEFHDPDLESSRAQVEELIQESYKIARPYVHREHDRDWATTGFACLVEQDVFEARMKELEKLDKNNRAIAEAYETLFRLFRKRLGLDLRFPGSAIQ